MAGLIRVHSGYSFYRGTARVEDLVERAAGLGWNNMALTDLNGLYGALWFWDMARERGINPILGAELDDRDGERAVLLVKSLDGWAALCRMISERHLDPSFSLQSALSRPLPGLAALVAHESLARSLLGAEGLDLYLIAPPHAIHRAARTAARLGLRPVAASSVYYLDGDDRFIHRLLRAMDLKTSISAVGEEELCPDPAWLPSPAEFASWYEPLPEAVRHLAELIEKCRLTLPPWGDTVLFDFEGMGPRECFQRLCHKVKQGAQKRYGALSPRVRSRLRKELALIRDRGFSSYFLIIEDIVSRFPITCGRGSAAASVVSYCLFITHVDPVRHNLMFERFLSAGRKDPPDIDVDFPWDERDNVLDYVFGRYGPERTAMVANHLCFKSRAAVRQVARAMGLPEPETSRVTRRMHGFHRALAPVGEMRADPRFRGVPFEPPWDTIVQTALRLEGLPFGLSVHCGGVVIADRIKERVPLQTAAKGVNIIHWEKDQTEDAGLIKLDLLGNRSLAVIRDGLEAVRAGGADVPEYSTLDPLDDPPTRNTIASGRTMGVFYIESPATRQLQEKAGAGDFEHVVIHSSIIRPAAHRFINQYVRRLKGEPWEPVHPLLGRVLSETYGIMVYQEDVMKAAIHLAGFRIEEADELRRVLSKKHKAKRLAQFEKMFMQGAGKRGATPEQAAAAWDMIMSFTGYSFCKPHSASYALVSFKSAWLKTHHPPEFMAAVISNQGGYYPAWAYLSEARRMGIEVRPPDVNRSGIKYVAEQEALRVGLMQIKGLDSGLAQRIIEERERSGGFAGLADFLWRVGPDPAQARLLIKARCFDALEGEEQRAALLWAVNAWERSASGGARLFGPELKAPRGLRPLPASALVEHELEALGCPVTRHPLDLYADALRGLPLTWASEFRQKLGRPVVAAGVCVTGKLTETREGRVMEFVSFEDFTGIYETVFFPRTYSRFCHIIETGRAYILRGRVTEELGALSLQVEGLSPVSRKGTGRKGRGEVVAGGLVTPTGISG